MTSIGCPVDSICKYGMGSALMGRKSKLEGIVRGMTEILQVPVTVKMRTSLVDGKDIAHNLFPEVKSWYVKIGHLFVIGVHLH